MILSIDLGSTNFKAALFDLSLTLIGESSVPSPYIHNDGERTEMDAVAVKQETITLIKQLCKDAGIKENSITAVTLDSQAQNFAIFDKNDKPVTPVISWLDQRSKKEAAELWERFKDDWHRHASFPKIDGSMQLAHLLWLQNNMPEVFADDYKVVTLPGMVFNIFAPDINLTDNNLAAMSGTYSLLHNNWYVDALQYCKILPEKMPQCVPIGSKIKVHANCPEQLGLDNELLLVPAGNDQTAGAVGNGCSSNDIIATLGTALVAYRRTGEMPGPYSESGCWGPYPEGGYYELTFTSSGCLSLDWAREVLMPGESLKSFDGAVARAIPGINEKTGMFYPGLIRTEKAWQGEFTNNDEKAYAILEGIAFDLYNLIFNGLSAPSTSAIKVIGGGRRSMVWMQLIADILNCPVSAGNGDSLLGGAAMAIGKTIEQTDPGLVFHPDKNRVSLLETRRRNYNKTI